MVATADHHIVFFCTYPIIKMEFIEKTSSIITFISSRPVASVQAISAFRS